MNFFCCLFVIGFGLPVFYSRPISKTEKAHPKQKYGHMPGFQPFPQQFAPYQFDPYGYPTSMNPPPMPQIYISHKNQDLEHSSSRNRITDLIEAFGKIVDSSDNYQEIRENLLKMLESDEMDILEKLNTTTSTLLPTQIEAPITE